jgi:hypothetical protein
VVIGQDNTNFFHYQPPVHPLIWSRLFSGFPPYNFPFP